MKFMIFYVLLPLAAAFIYGLGDASFARPAMGHLALGLFAVYALIAGFEAENK